LFIFYIRFGPYCFNCYLFYFFNFGWLRISHHHVFVSAFYDIILVSWPRSRASKISPVLLRSFILGFFLISSFNIRLWGLEFCRFFLFSLCGVIPSHGLVNPSWLRGFFLCFLNLFFFNFPLHHLVCLRVDLHCFIQFLMCKFIMILRMNREFDILTRIKFWKKNYFFFQLILQCLLY